MASTKIDERGGGSRTDSVRRALLFTPYLRSLGGGERYLFALARYLNTELRLAVTIASPEIPPLWKFASLGFDTDFVHMLACDLSSFRELSTEFDLSIEVTNRVPAGSMARLRYTHVQFPYIPLSQTHRENKRLFGRTIVNSQFTRRWVKKRWGVDAKVLYPPAALGAYDEKKKENLILSVGRFIPDGNSKRQEILVAAYRSLPVEVRQAWRFVLAGAVRDDPVCIDYAERVRLESRDLNVDVLVNVSESALRALFESAKLFWHATGYERRRGEPERAEHFGIATVEAMSYGTVPLVYGDGGQLEILTAGNQGFFWTSLAELRALTIDLIREDEERKRMAIRAALRSRKFDFAHFMMTCNQVFSEL
jgi:glycosyltransferase involved in cell wall biosynthesis